MSGRRNQGREVDQDQVQLRVSSTRLILQDDVKVKNRLMGITDLDQMDAEDDDVKPTWLDKLRRRSPEQIRKAHRTRQQIRQRADREWLNTRARNLKAEENQERMDMMYPPTRWEKFKRVLRKIKPPEEVGDDRKLT